MILRLAALALCSLTVCAADTVVLATGGRLDGTIIQQNDQAVVLAMGIGTITLQRSRIAGIEHQDDPPPAPLPPELADERLPAWDAVVAALAQQPWASGLRQIPATVIDAGVMRAVPYSSYRCGPGGAVEANVYGDPESPVCLELGVYGPAAADPRVRGQLVDVAAQAFVHTPLNRAIVRGLDRAQDIATRRGLTMEITPPSAPDAYGAWWVAVYFLDRVEKARAAPAETESISMARADAATRAGTDPGDWQAEDIRMARVAPPAVACPSPGVAAGGSSWGGGGGRVYVRGYIRKDGTYVRPHARRR